MFCLMQFFKMLRIKLLIRIIKRVEIMVALTVKQFTEKIKSKSDLYDALIRNGYFMPSKKSSLVTEAYMIGIMEGKVFCSKTETIKLRGCSKPP